MIAAIFALALAGEAAAAAPPPNAEVVYTAAPTRREKIEVYPSVAWNHGASGVAMLSCLVAADGRLSDCQVKSEDPGGLGFGKAALRLVPKYRLAPANPGQSIAGGRIEVPVEFLMPSAS